MLSKLHSTSIYTLTFGKTVYNHILNSKVATKNAKKIGLSTSVTHIQTKWAYLCFVVFGVEMYRASVGLVRVSAAAQMPCDPQDGALNTRQSSAYLQLPSSERSDNALAISVGEHFISATVTRSAGDIVKARFRLAGKRWRIRRRKRGRYLLLEDNAKSSATRRHLHSGKFR